MLTLRQLRYFEALADTLHFGRAARRLNISQPALSAQIAQMETFFGCALLQRGPSAPVRLTREGVDVERRGRAILASVRDLESLGTAGTQPLGRHLRIGMIATVAPYLIPRLLPRLAADRPALTVELRESVTRRLLDDLAAGDLDCAIIAEESDRPGIDTVALFEDPFFLAVPAGWPGDLPARIDLETLDSDRLILLEDGHCLRDQALQVCGIARPGALERVGATSLSTVLRMVAAGMGTTLIPRIAVADETRRDDIVVRPFLDPAPARTLTLAFRADANRRGDLDALADILRAVRPS